MNDITVTPTEDVEQEEVLGVFQERGKDKKRKK